MSYNIDNWKTKKLENLTIPLKSFYEAKKSDWYPDEPSIINPETMEVEIEGGCEGLSVKGVLKDGIIHVTKIEMYGEGSASFKSYILDDVFKQSKGELEAILVWEGGKSITSLKVKDGVIEEKDIEL